MRTSRNISRSKDVHGKELNRFFFEYVHEANGKTKYHKKLILKKWNKQWTDYCYKHRKHKVIPPSPDGLRMLIKDLTMINQVELLLGLTKTKPNIIVRLISKLRFK